jgi:phosphomethylpyrimidine synthase
LQTIEIGSNLRDRPRTKCGAGAPTLVIASVGTSSDTDDLADELAKVRAAVRAGAQAVTDHSFFGNFAGLHKQIAATEDVILSAVTCYEFAASYSRGDWAGAAASSAIDVLEDQVSRGIDMITVHASVRKQDLALLSESTRLIPTTSKGGGIVSNYVRHTGLENPYYEHFDDVLRILRSHGVVLSLGTALRAASVCDHWDQSMATELTVMSELVERSLAAGVAVMVEGLGHAPMDAIPTYVQLTKAHCHGVPYRVLPMATDRALGFDHISGAIGTAVAVAAGADAVTAMSRSEHIGLPSIDDTVEGVVAARIGAACGELVKLRDFREEEQMSRTRWARGCKGDWTAAIYPIGAESELAKRGRLDDQMIQCRMCGEYCGIANGIASVIHPPA